MSISYNFSDKVVLITGSGGGIGSAIAILFAKSGANVVVTDCNENNMSLVAKQCREVLANKSRVLEVVADITKEDDCKRLIDLSVKELGKIDILVNNAAIVLHSFITDPDYIKVFKKLITTNLEAMIYLTHISVEHLAKTKGNIINISSISSNRVVGYKIQPQNEYLSNSTYGMTKAAVDMFTKCAAVELGDKRIRVNSVNPGVINTDFFISAGGKREEQDAMFERMKNELPVHRVGESTDVANAVLFLASDDSSFITGTNMVVDGGQLAANVS